MRSYYLFYINEDLLTIYQKNTYFLYNSLKTIYNLPKNNIINGYYLINNLVNSIDKEKLNNNLKKYLMDNDNYTNYYDHHFINNYYTKESSELIIKNIFLKIKTTKNKPYFFSYFGNKNNIFICDFENKDYFWLHECLV